MKKILSILFLLMIAYNAVGQVTVEIDFGAGKTVQSHQVTWQEGMTALTALQYCMPIEAKPVKDYIFVSEISGVKNIPFETAWYYEINDKKPRLLAYKQSVNNGDKIKWIYRKDICSSQPEVVTVEIRFGTDRPKQIYKVDWRDSLTVVNALLQQVTVETYPFENKSVFVSAIDGKRCVPKESFWVYFINGKKADKIATTKLLNKEDHIIWEFRLRDQRQDKPIYND